ncbi:hypothetical protein E2562_011463 [Oryza meyeriana var. granulata]|uniref:RING-type E3 ubiquitin transferase n=1 Tax=Oryza meyeriana var. granulata TaxID=110450 RepID=A0A6G1D244_9ORYZ|nr:hypothetical protein E2562_011463 [Oryza meyeriana var. granulata]
MAQPKPRPEPPKPVTEPPKPGPADGNCEYDCLPPPPPSSHGHRRVVIALVTTASVLFVILLACSIYCFIRRRHRQRLRRDALLAGPPAAAPGGGGPPAAPVADVNAGDGVGVGEEEVLHHAWHIRTVGLDEAAIDSIAFTRYRAGAGFLGAFDCSVCLGEFLDGDLLRLLPKCGHVFHVPCIDSWLRAHVNCPLCRADVLHPADADADEGEHVTPAGANDDTAADQDSSTANETTEHGNTGQQQGEQYALRIEIDRRDQPSSPEPPHRSPTSHAQNFRRVASMDSPPASAEELPEPEDEQSSKEKQGSGDAACGKVSSGSGRLHHMRRSLSGGGRRSLPSRHGRSSSLMLPL